MALRVSVVAVADPCLHGSCRRSSRAPQPRGGRKKKWLQEPSRFPQHVFHVRGCPSSRARGLTRQRSLRSKFVTGVGSDTSIFRQGPFLVRLGRLGLRLACVVFFFWHVRAR